MATTTSDLISASRALDPASRALLNLWLHRGLDDLAIAHLSGGSAEEVAERRRRLVDRLAEEVHSPPDEVRAALEGLAGSEPLPRPSTRAAVEPEGRPGNGANAGALIIPGDPDPEPEAVADLVVPASAEVSPAANAAAAALVLPGEPEPPTDPEILVPATADVETQDDREAPDAVVILPGAATTEAPAAEPAQLIVPETGTGTGTESNTPAADRAADRERERRRRPAAVSSPRSSPFPAALGFALGAVIVTMVGIAALSGGSGGAEEGSVQAPRTPPATPSATRAATRPAPAPTPLEPIPGGPEGVRGAVAVRQGMAVLTVDGLERPIGDYEVWLFNTVVDSQSLGRLGQRRFRLPPDRGRYRYLEVSLEPRSDRIPAHSGRTVLRAPVPD